MPATSKTLSRLLGSLYEAAAEPALWALLLEQLASQEGLRRLGFREE
jgi:hypothetical protein